MIIENVKPNLADAVPNKEECKAELLGKKKPHERKLKKKFKRKLKAARRPAREQSATLSVLAAHSITLNASEIP